MQRPVPKSASHNNLTSKVLVERTICYCSNFDLNFNEWLLAKENMLAFADNLLSNLGPNWHIWFQDASEVISSDVLTGIKFQQLNHATSPHFCHLFNCYLLLCYGNPEISFETFFTQSVKYLTTVAKCTIKNNDILLQLIESFFQVCQVEYTKLKLCSDQDGEFENKLTERALADYNKRQEQMQQMSTEISSQHDTLTQKPEQNVSLMRNNYSHYSNFIPGLNFIRNQVIKPLLFATEKVVEQYIARPVVQEVPQKSEETISEKLSQIHLSENLSQSSLKKRRYRELNKCWEMQEDDHQTLVAIEQDSSSSKSFGNKRQIKLEKKFLNKVCFNEDLARTKPQGFNQQETITGNFATMIFELDKTLIGQLQNQDQSIVEQQVDEQVDSIKFIKTNKTFYNNIVLLWLKFTWVKIGNADEFTNFAVQNLKLSSCSAFIRALKFFSKILFDEYNLSIKENPVRNDFADCCFFANVKSSMLFHWEVEVVQKSAKFCTQQAQSNI